MLVHRDVCVRVTLRKLKVIFSELHNKSSIVHVPRIIINENKVAVRTNVELP